MELAHLERVHELVELAHEEVRGVVHVAAARVAAADEVVDEGPEPRLAHLVGEAPQVARLAGEAVREHDDLGRLGRAADGLEPLVVRLAGRQVHHRARGHRVA